MMLISMPSRNGRSLPRCQSLLRWYVMSEPASYDLSVNGPDPATCRAGSNDFVVSMGRIGRARTSASTCAKAPYGSFNLKVTVRSSGVSTVCTMDSSCASDVAIPPPRPSTRSNEYFTSAEVIVRFTAPVNFARELRRTTNVWASGAWVNSAASGIVL